MAFNLRPSVEKIYDVSSYKAKNNPYVPKVNIPVATEEIYDRFHDNSTNNRIFGHNDPLALSIAFGDPLYRLKDNRYLSSLNGLDLNKYPTSKSFAKEVVDIYAIACNEFKIEAKNEKLNIDSEFYLQENTRGIINGEIELLNTSHPGLKVNNFVNQSSKAIAQRGEDLESGDLLEFYVPYWNRNVIQAVDYWDKYKHTLPTSLQYSKKLTFRYRKADRGGYTSKVKEVIQGLVEAHRNGAPTPFLDRQMEWGISHLDFLKEAKIKHKVLRKYARVIEGGSFGKDIQISLLMI